MLRRDHILRVLEEGRLYLTNQVNASKFMMILTMLKTTGLRNKSAKGYPTFSTALLARLLTARASSRNLLTILRPSLMTRSDSTV